MGRQQQQNPARAAAWVVVVAAVAALALSAAPSAHACNEVFFKDRCYAPSPMVSGRTLSFPTAMSPEVAWVRRGGALTYLDVAPGVPPPRGAVQPSKHDFVCVAHARPELSAAYPADAAVKETLICSDGINGAGLSAALLYHFDVTAMPAYDNSSKTQRDAIMIMNLAGWALANAGTVDELRRLLAQTQLVWNPAYKAFARKFSYGAYDHAPIHFSFADRSGKGIVVEWRDGKTEVLDNKFGVFANSNFFAQNVAHTEQWLDRMYANPAAVYPSVKAGLGRAQFRVSSEPAERGERRAPTFWAPPGDYSSPSRFARMAMLLNATAATCYSAKSVVVKGALERTSPDFVPPGLPAANPSLLSVLQVVNTVYLPRGQDDDGLAFDAEEFTPLSMLRDHGRDAAAGGGGAPGAAPVFYYRTGNNMQYKAVDLGRVEWGKLGAKGVRRAPATYSPQPWFTPASNEWAAHPAAR